MQKQLLHNLLGGIKSPAFEVTYWDGITERYGAGAPCFKLLFREKLPGRKFVQDPVLTLGEAYMDGVIDFFGDLEEITKTVLQGKEIFEGRFKGHALARSFPRRLRPNSLRKQQEDIQQHYDLGNDFFSLWLDETMSYSCAYFQSPADSLSKAQNQKIDHVLKKLELKPGETLLDIGSGWGWLIIRAAREYGVKAMGITLSQEQFEETRRRIKELGLDGQVEVELMDYRVLASGGRVFDKIASVGMFEHVGRANYPEFMSSLRRLLKEGGLVLLHTISHLKEGPVNSWIEKYIFRGGYIPSLREAIWQLADYDFHVIDVESLRVHYAMTLERWAESFEHNVDRVREMFGERFVRMWRLYLHSCAASFWVSGLNVHQILFSGGLNNNLALTREHLYRQVEC